MSDRRVPFRRLSHLVLTFALLGAACRSTSEPVADAGGTVGVSVAEARTDALRDLTTASGVVVPSTAADATIYAMDPAEIVELPKQEKDVVTLGDVLVRLDIPALTQEYSALELAVLEATSRLDRAKADLTRQSSLFDRGLIARNTYDLSRLEHAAAESHLAQARTQLESHKGVENRAVIRAPFSGVVTAVFHQVGDQVRPGAEDPIMRVIDPTRVQVSVQVPVAALARIIPGQSANVQAIAAATAEPATVVSKPAMVDPGAPTGEVRLAFTNPATLPLDTPVSVEILLDQRSSALVVPTPALRRDDLGTFVVVVGDDLIARRRDVRVGLTTQTLVEIAAGLSIGERVVTSDISSISDGMAVTIAR